MRVKKSILFVDDEPNILAGIKRMLRSMRKQYDFHFGESGRVALEIMEAARVDVVVSDMRMPGMDGAEFLSAVRERHPHVIRIMLTGQANEESVYRTVNVVHQFLTKPCDPDLLKEVIIRSCALRDLLTSIQLKELVSGIDRLPSLPETYAQLQQVLRREEASAEDVAGIIEQDIGMTAKLLQLVNSSFFGLFQKVDSPARAVRLLGFDTVKTLVLGVKIFADLKVDSELVSLDYLQDHSMMVAECSKKIALATTEDMDLVNDCFLAGMLHDIGRLLLVTRMSESYLPLVEKARAEQSSLVEEERAALSATHGDVGAYLVGLWGFSSEILEAIAFHNRIAEYDRASFSAALAVHVADFHYYRAYPQNTLGSAPQLQEEYIAAAGCTEYLASWSEKCAAVLESGDGEES